MADPLWRGPAVALVTLFGDDGAVDARATGEHAARVVDAGMRAVLVAGSTGEASTLTDDERRELVAAVREACPGVPLVAGASGEWWGQAAARVRAAVAAGADAVLVAPPRLGTDLVGYYAAVAEAAGAVPVLAYHYPPGAGGPVPVELLPGLPVSGIKDSSGDPVRLGHELGLDWSGACYVGSAALLGTAGWLGATGAIVAAGNLVPSACSSAWDRDATAQLEVIRAEREAKAGPGGLKAAIARRYGTSAYRRIR